MSKMKKLVSFVLAGAMTLAMSVCTFAATPGITDAEQKILDEARAKATYLGVDVNTSKTYQEYYSQASTYLAKNDLSQAQIDAMVAAVDEAASTAKAEMDAKGVAKLGDLDKTAFEALFEKVSNQVTTAAKAVGIVIKRDANGGFVVEPVTTSNDDKKTDVYVQGGGSNKVVQQTGADLAADKVDTAASIDTTATSMTSTVVMSVMFVGAVAVCGVVAKKKNLFSGVEA